LEGHYIFIEVNQNTDEPLLPTKNAEKFVNHYGFLVRDKLPINVRE
jgi:hypothetical protein